jgi:hypothetical protein
MKINSTKMEQCKFNSEAVRIESEGVQQLLKCPFKKNSYFKSIYTLFTFLFNMLYVKKMETKLIS